MIRFPNGSKRRAALRKGLALVLLLAGAWPLAAVLRAQVAAESRAAPLTAAASSLPARRLPIVAHRRYTMHGAIRPLYLFWIRRNDIGSAEISWRRGPDGEVGYELTVGSDPARAPRRINRWGYISEEARRDGVSQLGIMRASDEQTLAEAERVLEHDKKGGTGFPYKGIRTDVIAGKGRTGVFWVQVERDLTYRQLDELLALIPPDFEAERAYELPPGVRGGYLGTLTEIMAASVRWHAGKGAAPRVEGQSFRYVYYGNAYDMTLRASRVVALARYKGRTFANVVEGQFRVVNLKTGYRTDFRVDYGTEGALAEVPVHGVFQPRWWLEVEVVLDPAPAPGAAR